MASQRTKPIAQKIEPRVEIRYGKVIHSHRPELGSIFKECFLSTGVTGRQTTSGFQNCSGTDCCVYFFCSLKESLYSSTPVSWKTLGADNQSF